MGDQIEGSQSTAQWCFSRISKKEKLSLKCRIFLFLENQNAMFQFSKHMYRVSCFFIASKDFRFLMILNVEKVWKFDFITLAGHPV